MNRASLFFRDAETGRAVPENEEAPRVAYGSGRSSSALATLKIDELAPTLSASERTAAAAKPGALATVRSA